MTNDLLAEQYNISDEQATSPVNNRVRAKYALSLSHLLFNLLNMRYVDHLHIMSHAQTTVLHKSPVVAL
jgi:hypothetical protein